METQSQLSENTQREIRELTGKILAVWKATSQNIIVMGRYLARLRSLMSREQYIEHLKLKFSMSEFHSHRLIAVAERFGQNDSTAQIIATKPSVLYYLATAEDLAKVERLIAGDKILINGKRKSIEEITVREAIQIKQTVIKRTVEQDDKSIDLRRAENAHRELATLIESIQDFAKDLSRYKRQKLEIKNEELVRKYILETIECLKETSALLN